MKVKLLIATVDTRFSTHISNNISEHHANTIDVSVCNTLECLQEALSKRKYDVALLDSSLIEHADTKSIHLPLFLWSENDAAFEVPTGYERIQKYRRISVTVATVLERFAKVSKDRHESDSDTAKITTIWSPAGGTGKTTIALAYSMFKANYKKEVFYLNLEPFSSIPAYFNENGRSISAVFELLDSHEGNVKMLIQGVSCCENGIFFLNRPDNYDDMCILSSDNTVELITSCAQLADELVIDLSNSCDERTRKVFELSDNLLIVTDPAASAEIKLKQFISQNNVFESIKDKVILIANKGTLVNQSPVESVISFPYIQSNDAIGVYKALSEIGFSC